MVSTLCSVFVQIVEEMLVYDRIRSVLGQSECSTDHRRSFTLCTMAVSVMDIRTTVSASYRTLSSFSELEPITHIPSVDSIKWSRSSAVPGLISSARSRYPRHYFSVAQLDTSLPKLLFRHRVGIFPMVADHSPQLCVFRPNDLCPRRGLRSRMPSQRRSRTLSGASSSRTCCSSANG